ncbi:MAG: thioredoxin domain-containing protein [Patescibacteria group bacterium]
MAKLTKKERKEQKKTEYQEVLKKQKRNEMFKKFGIWGGAALILAASIWGLVALSNSTPGSSSQDVTAPPISKDDITIGSPSAKVSLIEYSDFQCPACAAYHPLVNQLLTEYEGKIYFAYRFFPLTQIHKNALISSQAGYAAYKQDKFKEMYDMLFSTQNDWAENNSPSDIFVEYAGKIGLDVEKFKTDMDSEEAKSAIGKGLAEGTDIGVNSTPTFFLNNKKITTPGTYDNFKKLIEDEIAKN